MSSGKGRSFCLGLNVFYTKDKTLCRFDWCQVWYVVAFVSHGWFWWSSMKLLTLPVKHVYRTSCLAINNLKERLWYTRRPRHSTIFISQITHRYPTVRSWRIMENLLWFQLLLYIPNSAIALLMFYAIRSWNISHVTYNLVLESSTVWPVKSYITFTLWVESPYWQPI